MRFHKLVLPNGLTVIGEENPAALSMAAGYFVRTGSRDESPEVSGVSHFLEHMLFKGTDRRTAEDVNREFDEIGADYNAFTGDEYTVYHGAVLPEEQPRLLDLLTDMMRPTLRDEDFQVEKTVILNEIAKYMDRPSFRVLDHARSTYYYDHPLGQSVLGTPETIGRMTRDQMYAYWRQRYAPNNLVLALTGCFDWEAAVCQAAEGTAAWEPADCPRPHPPFTPRPQVCTLVDEKIHRAHLTCVAPGVPAQSDEVYVADLVGDMLGGGDGSRLFWELVEPGLTDVISLSHDAEDGFGAFFGYASCDPGRAQEVIQRIRGVARKVTEEGFTTDEVERARRKVASGQVLSQETPHGRLYHV
ncbi:MAG: insulinase family protein, partial [Armatimonadetes bacterium]|nr:insulinase family protein [Armatimonadota bacterium]